MDKPQLPAPAIELAYHQSSYYSIALLLTNNDNITLSIAFHILEVPGSHSTTDLALTNGSESEVIPLAKEFIDSLSLSLSIDSLSLHRLGLLQVDQGRLSHMSRIGRLDVSGSRRRPRLEY